MVTSIILLPLNQPKVEHYNDNYNSKPRKDLDSIAYEAEQLESVFVEIINPRKKTL